eukprot:SAG22_NODE_15249_length_353_cov_1.011811_1_plen_69_part_10
MLPDPRRADQDHRAVRDRRAAVRDVAEAVEEVICATAGHGQNSSGFSARDGLCCARCEITRVRWGGGGG